MPTFNDLQDDNEPHLMESKYFSTCAECEQRIVPGDKIVWDPKERKAYHKDCGEDLL